MRDCHGHTGGCGKHPAVAASSGRCACNTQAPQLRRTIIDNSAFDGQGGSPGCQCFKVKSVSILLHKVARSRGHKTMKRSVSDGTVMSIKVSYVFYYRAQKHSRATHCLRWRPQQQCLNPPRGAPTGPLLLLLHQPTVRSWSLSNTHAKRSTRTSSGFCYTARARRVACS